MGTTFTIVRGCSLVMGLALMGTLASCDRKPPTPTPTPTSTATPTANEAGAAAVDWSRVTAVETGEAVLAYKTLARHADAWHKGAKDVITVRHDGVGAATDDAGNTMAMTPAAWKGIVEVVRAAKEPVLAVAGKSDFHSGLLSPARDTFGTLARYHYRLELVGDGELRLHNEGKRDDGV